MRTWSRVGGSVAVGAAVGAAVADGVLVARSRYLTWGATAAEIDTGLPGDDLLTTVGVVATRAISVRARPDQVWPWVAQLGQGRGGFYSYDALENLVGCHIHSASTIVDRWQDVAVGDQVRLHPEVALTVSRVEPGRALVLRGGVPMGDAPAPYDFTWAFVVRDGPAGTTRLVVRERYAYDRWWSPLVVEPVQVLSSVMSRRMLTGIQRRAQQAPPARASSPGQD